MNRKIPGGICSFFLGASLLIGLPSSGIGQVLYGSIVGTVTDPSGAVVPNSAVTATNTETGQTRSDTSDNSGRYNLTNLLPGTYSVTSKASGFRPLEQDKIQVTPNTVTRIDVQLEVGQASEKVNVSAQAVELQTDKADTHTEINSKEVTNIPLGGQRNYQKLIDLAPGATPGSFGNSSLDVPNQPLNTHVNGGVGQTNVTKIDGAESVNVWLPQYTGYVAPAETVDVVNVTTSAADADQGLAGSSSITVVTKSGTNNIHGSAFIFHNDQHLNARNFFLSPTTDKPVGIYNNYGGTIGGPIKKDKLFYFVSFDGTNQKTSANGIYTVPTAAQRAGNFSNSTTTIYNPFTGGADGSGRRNLLDASGNIPAALISPAALKIQSYIPSPNLPGDVNNFSATGGPIIDRYQYDAKVNYNRTDKHSIWIKYDNMFANTGGVGIFGAGGGPAPGPGGAPGKGRTSTQVASIAHTYVFSPTLVLDGNVGYQRMNQTVLGTDYGKDYSSVLGIPGLNGPDIRDSGFPNINFATYTGTGVPNWMPAFRTDETYTTDHSLAWTKGSHEVRFGFDLVRHHLNHWQPELSFGGPRGYFDFSGSITSDNVGAGKASAISQYNSYAQFLLGLSDNTQKGEQYILMTGREWQLGWFVQDRWQVSKKLTVSLGLRYELYPLMTRCCGKGIERYDPTTNDVYMGGRGSIPLNAGISVSHKLFAPRVGLAYRLDEKTVIRAGYGLNYDPIPFSRPLRGFYPLTINNNYSALNSLSVANLSSNQNTSQSAFIPSTLANGIPPVVGPDLSTGIVPLDPTASERSPNSFIHRGYVQSYNFTIERKLPAEIVMSAGYVGQHTVHQLADYDINAGYPGSGTTGLPQYATFGRTTATQMWDGYLSSEYNSLQIAFNRQFSNGLLLKGAYTWSHAIDYTDDDGWASVGWNWAPVFQRNRASAGFDRRHVFQLGWIYDLPFGTGKKFVNSGVASKIVGGWQLSGIESMYTGNPLTIGADATSLNAPDNTQTAQQVLAQVQRIGGVGPGAHYYNPAAFAPVTAANTFGSSGRNILAGPGVWNTDMSISRVFPIKEKLNFEFRTEFYNLPNTSHFGNPNVSVNNASFMQITNAYGERNIRFAGRFSW
ncbi:MAG: TonB-dependent receptor [Acidobacteriota bacterium]|nr:TonB-dependent receptor [Acidobacteriota bacterium]